MRPYALSAGEGRTYRWHGIDFTVKAGESAGRGVALMEYTTQQGEEPPDHVHPGEDEIFYVLAGEVAFRCGGEPFEVGAGGVAYLPRGIEHGYTVRSEEPARLLVVTAPSSAATGAGWGGFVAGIEREGEPVARPERAGGA